ncbi:hypothetical protein JB92DRAFT_1079229 [Gautieria morchelliformis]|nr:hypothetical protein JB92DRAFT_1079229 [Gautieria morchelliformis]
MQPLLARTIHRPSVSLASRMSLAPQSIVTALQALTPTKYSWVASLCLIVYDHLITLDLEVEHVWTRPRSLSRSLFIWTRYFGHAALIVAVTVILLIRVYAVYNRNKHILYGMVGFRVLMTAATVTLWVFYIPIGLGPPPIDGITGCLSSTTSRLFAYSLVPTMSNEVLIQDSILYFSSIFGVLFTNGMIIFFAPQILVLVGFGFEYAVPCTMGSRLLLSMLQQASREHKSALPSDPVGYPVLDVRMQDLSTKHVERPVKIAPATSW